MPPTVPVYVTATYPDGSSRNLKLWPDQHGVRAYERVGARLIERVGAWPGAQVLSTRSRPANRYVVTFTPADGEEFPFAALEHWGECLGCTHNPLKGFRAPAEWETE
jgi:hypothetical protein